MRAATSPIAALQIVVLVVLGMVVQILYKVALPGLPPLIRVLVCAMPPFQSAARNSTKGNTAVLRETKIRLLYVALRTIFLTLRDQPDRQRRHHRQRPLRTPVSLIFCFCFDVVLIKYLTFSFFFF